MVLDIDLPCAIEFQHPEAASLFDARMTHGQVANEHDQSPQCVESSIGWNEIETTPPHTHTCEVMKDSFFS